MGGEITLYPPATDGIVGKLTPEQEDKLRQFWSTFFNAIESAPVESQAEIKRTARSSDEDVDCSKDNSAASAGKGIPKSDDAKAKLAAEREMKEATDCLRLYGSKQFLAVFWRSAANEHPDAVMLRFLRARKWDVQAGFCKLAAAIKWRIESDVEQIVESGEEGMLKAKGFLHQFESGKTYAYGTDRHGRPIVYVHVRLHKLFDQSATALEKYVIAQMENVRFLLADGADKITLIFDMTGFGLSNMDWKCILHIVKCFEAYYPESLNAFLIHNSPWVFWAIWKILGPMLDPVVRAKVQFTYKEEDLKVHIAPEHLVKKLGGDGEWEWKYTPPVVGENSAMQDTKTKDSLLAERHALEDAFTAITRDWINSKDEHVAQLRELCRMRLRAHYYELDKYVRGRNVYHRQGTIKPNGLVTFDYPFADHRGTVTETRGYDECRESLILRARELESKLRDAGVKVDDRLVLRRWEGLKIDLPQRGASA